MAASIGVGAIFLVAAIAKLRNRALLPGVIANYRLLPEMLVTPAAILLPITELGVGAALILGSRPLAPLLAMALLLVFAAAMAINIRRGRRHIDCGCGHAGLRQDLGWGMVARNLVLVALLALRLVGDGGLDASNIAVAAMSGLALFVITMMFNALNALPGRQLGSSRG